MCVCVLIAYIYIYIIIIILYIISYYIYKYKSDLNALLSSYPPTWYLPLYFPDMSLHFVCRNVRARGPVEQWLGSVENGMFDTVKKSVDI